MIDNFEQIKQLLKFEEEQFYFIQILQRNKDGNSINGNNRNRLIYSYYINSEERYDNRTSEIKKMCALFNARAMIHLSPRNYQTIALQHLALCAEQIAGGNVTHLHRSYNSTCGRNKGTSKLWIIDLDGDEATQTEAIDKMHNFINHLQPYTALNPNKIEAKIPSKTGLHIITHPFNLQKFEQQYPNIEVHKNNPTNLYIPS